uniref:Uncharacterized protein n=1 Tax=Romanomermis culicivorax TaxID=13658 RepID=A0A915HN75_ROMCU
MFTISNRCVSCIGNKGGGGGICGDVNWQILQDLIHSWMASSICCHQKSALMAASMQLDPWWFNIFAQWNWCSVWSTMDAGMTSWQLSLTWRYKIPLLVKKIGGFFVALPVWRVAMILV